MSKSYQERYCDKALHYWDCMDAYSPEKEFALQQEDWAASIMYGLIAMVETGIPVTIFFVFRQ